MCGIAGFIGRGARPVIQDMTYAIRHRGPDADGFFTDESNGVFFGHRRLSILDIEGGAQPMATREGDLVITFNGEIYNYASLKHRLQQKGHQFVTSHSDTEVLLHGYREWGEALPEKLNGMWAFAIYDRQKRQVFISRDRFGKKPFFYSHQQGAFAFSSELSSLVMHPAVPTIISETYLKKYFAYGYIPSPGSIYEQVYQLPGGHNLIFDMDTGCLKIKKFWEFVLEPFDRIPDNPEEEWGEELRHLISKAVQRRMMSDVPLGVFLSGGIDSSCVAAFAAAHQQSGKLKTFSISFDEDSFDESAYAAMAAEYIGTDHYNSRLSMDKSKSLLPDIVSTLDEPMGDSSLLPTYLLSKVTRQHVTVALGGDGADELFAGYDPFRALNLARLYSKLFPKPIHKGIQKIMGMLPVSHKNMSLDFRLKRTLRGLDYPPCLWNPVWLGPLSPSDVGDLFGGPVDIEELYSEAIELWDHCKSENLIDQTLQFYTRFYLQDDILVKVDRASMMNSLEVRAPFLDIELVDFVRRIPARYKYRNGQTKYILKKALEPVLPQKILYRSKKGFGIPVGQWLKGSSFKMSEYSSVFETLNSSFIKDAYQGHLRNESDNRAFLWNYWLLEQWGAAR